MQASLIYSKLKKLFPENIENVNLPLIASNFIDESQALSFLISSSLPHLSIDQIHTLCRKQEKNVMDRILEINQIDLYEQIANVCPSQKDLKNMSIDEVALKINIFTTQMALQERIKGKSDDQMNSYLQSEQAIYIESQPMDYPMEIDEINEEAMDQAQDLHNIFEEQYNTRLPWNQMCIYDHN